MTQPISKPLAALLGLVPTVLERAGEVARPLYEASAERGSKLAEQLKDTSFDELEDRFEDRLKGTRFAEPYDRLEDALEDVAENVEGFLDNLEEHLTSFASRVEAFLGNVTEPSRGHAGDAQGEAEDEDADETVDAEVVTERPEVDPGGAETGGDDLVEVAPGVAVVEATDDKPAKKPKSEKKPKAEKPAKKPKSEKKPKPAKEPKPAKKDEATAVVAPESAAGTLPVEGYDALSIGQLRNRLRNLGEADVEALLAHEEATSGRTEYVKALENRLEKLRSEG